MNKFIPYLKAFAFVSVGFAIGASWVLRMHTFLEWHSSSTSTSDMANCAVTALHNIRTGDTNEAIKRLELRLDLSVIRLAEICRECPNPEKERTPLDALARAKNYRAQFPRSTNYPSLDRAVAQAFTIVNEKK